MVNVVAEKSVIELETIVIIVGNINHAREVKVEGNMEGDMIDPGDVLNGVVPNQIILI